MSSANFARDRALLRPSVKLVLQSLQRKRWSGFMGPFSPTGAAWVLPLRLVLRLLHFGQRTRRFFHSLTPLSGRLPDTYYEKGS